MPLPPRLYAGDEELGKKDDDHKPGSQNVLGFLWKQRRHHHGGGPQRRNLKRVALGALALIALYYFFYNMPTDLENPRQRPHYDHGGVQHAPAPVGKGSSGSNTGDSTDVAQRTFNGPIKFYDLATTLHAVSSTKGSALINRNVLFAAANLQSVARLLPIACEMASKERNFVHFAVMGRDDIALNIIKAANGVTKKCMIIFHDARPDFSVQSSDYRMTVSVSAGFNHINTFVHPQATFIDGSDIEETFFTKAIKVRASSLGRTVIELPDNAEQTLMWATKLDSASLSVWNKISIDLLIHAPTSSSGSLIRLLESLKQVDFFATAPPRLMIELPHDVDPATEKYLETFKWPPNSDSSTGTLLTLHHRIPQRGITAEENSIRLMEAFWPADGFFSHVLVLSPLMELSPVFFHYLKYTMLEYKYSAEQGYQNLLGISLELPTTHLNDSATFSPPLTRGDKGGITPFLWGAPNSNACLYFGDKWVELHDFMSHLLSAEHLLPAPETLGEKLVSKTYPSWLEHVLKFSRARGYQFLYPNFEAPEFDAFATAHYELYQAPEEYTHDPEMEASDSNELTADPAHHLSLKAKETPLVTSPLLSILPMKGELPKVSQLPLLAWDGEAIEQDMVGVLAVEYSRIFRKELGGCDAGANVAMESMREDFKAGDLFCLIL